MRLSNKIAVIILLIASIFVIGVILLIRANYYQEDKHPENILGESEMCHPKIYDKGSENICKPKVSKNKDSCCRHQKVPKTKDFSTDEIVNFFFNMLYQHVVANIGPIMNNANFDDCSGLPSNRSLTFNEEVIKLIEMTLMKEIQNPLKYRSYYPTPENYKKVFRRMDTVFRSYLGTLDINREYRNTLLPVKKNALLNCNNTISVGKYCDNITKKGLYSNYRYGNCEIINKLYCPYAQQHGEQDRMKRIHGPELFIYNSFLRVVDLQRKCDIKNEHSAAENKLEEVKPPTPISKSKSDSVYDHSMIYLRIESLIQAIRRFLDWFKSKK